MSAPQKPKAGSKWGSWMSGAVAGLESKLDTILAEDDQASAKSRTQDGTARQAQVVAKADAGISRTASTRSRTNDRLQERLAKAAKGSAARSGSRSSIEVPSRTASPALEPDATRMSVDLRAPDAPAEPAVQQPVKEELQEKPQEIPQEISEGESKAQPEAIVDTAVQEKEVVKDGTEETIPNTQVSIPTLEVEMVASPRPSIDSSRPSVDIPRSESDLNVDRIAPPSDPTQELQRLRDAYSDQQEEIHTYLERIDALQSKLKYLAESAVKTARAAASESTPGSLDKKLAEKDEQVALLMTEGQKLSKTELRHMNTIKKLRVRVAEEEKSAAELKRKLTTSEKSLLETTDRARRAESAEKTAAERMKVLGRIEKDMDALRDDKEDAGRTIADLRRQLQEANQRADEVQKKVQTGALEAERKLVADLRDELADSKIEKKLAEDRAKADAREIREDATRQQERAQVAEIELRGEITNLETKLELLRTRTEEVSSSATGDSQAKLLRQIETLQTQYALASENWQGIESTLTSRVAALEKERDETTKRESDIRRKARDVNGKNRRLEEELETVHDKARSLEQDIAEHTAAMQKMQTRLSTMETTLSDARAEADREKKVFDSELQQRLEEEKLKWRLENSHVVPMTSDPNSHLRTESPTASYRRPLSYDPLGINARRNFTRTFSSDVALSPSDNRPQSRRSSHQHFRTPGGGTPPLAQDALPSLSLSTNGAGPYGLASMSQTPSIQAYDADDAFDTTSSPHRTINDMISSSTAHAGPSVQLVERMSAAVRRLESEKAVVKEEMGRLAMQRDEAREEVVSMMREVDEKRKLQERTEKAEQEAKLLDQRYQTTLEMLGEKSELVDELRQDVMDLKKIYRELVESTMK